MASLFSPIDVNFLSLSTKAGALIAAYWFIWIVYSRTLHPLAKVPGPLWPSLSRTWLMYRMYLGDYQLEQVALHEKYVLRTYVKHGYLIRTQIWTTPPDRTQ
jgi:hypothetical protein